MNNLAKLIRSARLAKQQATGPECRGQYSQAGVARHCNLPKQRICDYEAGRLVPSAETCVDLADALGLDSDQVLMAAGYLPSDVLSFLLRRHDVVALVRRIRTGRWTKADVEGIE